MKILEKNVYNILKHDDPSHGMPLGPKVREGHSKSRFKASTIAKIVKHACGRAGPQARMPRCTEAIYVATGKHM